VHEESKDGTVAAVLDGGGAHGENGELGVAFAERERARERK
jgi:hypothetical protein